MDIIVYHANCADGVVSAWICSRYIKERHRDSEIHACWPVTGVRASSRGYQLSNDYSILTRSLQCQRKDCRLSGLLFPQSLYRITKHNSTCQQLVVSSSGYMFKYRTGKLLSATHDYGAIGTKRCEPNGILHGPEEETPLYTMYRL